MFKIIIAFCMFVFLQCSAYASPSQTKITPTLPKSNFDIPINYHGGPMLGTEFHTLPNIYFIYYGNWPNNETTIPILRNFVANLDASAYYNINTTYTYRNGKPIINRINLMPEQYYDDYSLGKELTRQNIKDIAKRTIFTKKLPLDPNGVYVVLTSSDVNVQDQCTRSCSWHNFSSLDLLPLQIIWVGNPYPKCPLSCVPIFNRTKSPNNNVGADAMVNLLAYEINGTVTDLRYDAWFDDNRKENSDKCAWRFGNTKVDANFAYYNQTMNGTNYLIQDNWLNIAGGSCVTRY